MVTQVTKLSSGSQTDQRNNKKTIQFENKISI